MRNLAIIPARSGSKRIPQKNIKDFFGKPIIAYSIRTALESGLFESVMVSTDSETIAKISRENGATVPFMRSDANSNDYATTFEVLEEVLNKYGERHEKFDYACCIYPTAPLLTVETLHKAYDHMIKEKFDSVFPVLEFGFPIWRALTIDPVKSKVDFIWKENAVRRSQDLPKTFHDAGQFYWFDTKIMLNKKGLITDNSGIVLLDETQAQDIDTISDWRMAEYKYKVLNKCVE